MEYPEHTIVRIHDRVVEALTEDIYRTHIGRFFITEVDGRFSIGTFRNGRRLFLHEPSIKRYELRCDFAERDVIPDLGQDPDRLILKYTYGPNQSQLERLFYASVGYKRQTQEGLIPLEEIEYDLREYDMIEFEMINRKTIGINSKRGQFTEETFRWVYEALGGKK
ncbi:hypothetical protein HYV86_07850 [Candidatus Woesearchaeota archaeon]|nr:hypothetical protein [Candidatus Woesearchaeota archaeon]